MTRPTKYVLPQQTLQKHNLGIQQIKAHLFGNDKAHKICIARTGTTRTEHNLGIQHIKAQFIWK